MTPRKSLLWKFPWATLGRSESSQQFFSKIEEQKTRIPLFKNLPKLSVVLILVPNTTELDLQRALESLALQSFSDFEVVIAGPVSNNWKNFIREKTELKVQWLEWNEPFSLYKMKNRAAKLAQGEWLCFLNSDEILSPAALFEFALEVQRDSSSLIYCNTIRLDSKNLKIQETISKREFSWFSLLHHNYIGSFYWIRKSLFQEFQFRIDLGAQADQVLLLRVSEREVGIKFISKFLHYESRQVVSPELSIQPLVEHLQTKQFQANVSLQEKQVEIIPHIQQPQKKLVSVIICFKNKADWTLKAIKHLRNQIGEVPVEFILVNNGSDISELSKIQSEIALTNDVQLLSYAGAFNFAHMHNFAIKEKARGDYLLLLNNDVFWTGAKQLDSMVAWAQQAWVGTVGILLRYEHGGVQHAGLNVRFGGEARLVRVGNAQTEDVFTTLNREVFGNTFAACLFRREIFDQFGGFRELDIPNGFGDVSFNFECLKAGLKNLYLGQIEALHLESASRGSHYEYWEECVIEKEYPEILGKMLRSDLGINRVPQNDFEFGRILLQYFKNELRTRFPWLIQIKIFFGRTLNEIRHTIPKELQQTAD